MSKNYVICSKCVCDTTIPDIVFDKNGICNFCEIHERMEKQYPLNKTGRERLEVILKKIKNKGKNKEYDCVVGVSGGTDSSYLLYIAVNLGLKPLAVHYDNGWNSSLAVTNIKILTEKLGVDLYTYVNDWEEFKDLQISFLKASTSDAEIPTDVGIHGCLLRIASKMRIKYVLNGHSFRNESMMPIGWTYMDGKYIKSIQKLFGSKKLRTFPNVTIMDYFYYSIMKRIEVIPILNYVIYDKTEAIKVMEKELGWVYSGGHHHESYYTHFFQSFLLPTKFNIDKRIPELSGFIRTGQISRQESLEILNKSYPYEPELINYTISKLGITKESFEQILKEPIKTFKDYPTYYNLIKVFRFPIWVAAKMGIIPYLLYQKFFT
jgi:N-acetyl sugar amidotransferase